VEETIQVLEQYKEHLGFTHIEKESNLAKVSIVGSGMISNPGVAAEMFQVLATEGIHVKMVSTSEIKVSTVVDVGVMVKAVEALHVAFKLGEESVERVLN
jgi:aspartate kinase